MKRFLSKYSLELLCLLLALVLMLSGCSVPEESGVEPGGDTMWAQITMNKAMELANAIAANAQIAVRQSKAAIRRGLQTDMNTGVAYESEAFALCFATEDQKDAMKAFVNKEKLAGFKNR